jgi:hypothetical protein
MGRKRKVEAVTLSRAEAMAERQRLLKELERIQTRLRVLDQVIDACERSEHPGRIGGIVVTLVPPPGDEWCPRETGLT